MKPNATSISRRHFLAAAGATALAAKASLPSTFQHPASGIAFAACGNAIHSYLVQGTTWTPLETVASEAPVSLAADPATSTLHVLHAVSEHRGLPCGYIESFRVEQESGQLIWLSNQPLSLSAIQPSHLALSPSGGALAVAVKGGAAYNLLPILKDGRAGRPSAVRKETALSSSSLSRPSHISFSHDSNRIFALDQGTATLSVFSTKLGLPVLSRLSFTDQMRPTHLEMHKEANLIFVIDQATGRLQIVRHSPVDATLSLTSEIIGEGFCGPLAIDQASLTLVAAATHCIHLYRIQYESGELQFIQKINYPEPHNDPRLVLLDAPASSIYAVTKSSIFVAPVDTRYDYTSPFRRVAPAANAIAFFNSGSLT